MVHRRPVRSKQQRHEDLERLRAIFPGFDQLEGRVAPRTVKEYSDDATYYLRYCTFYADLALNPNTLRNWRQHLVTHTSLSPATINRRLNAIKTLVKESAALGHIDRQLAYDFSLVERVQIAPLRDRLKPTTRFLLTPEQVRTLCRQPDPTTMSGLRDRSMLLTLATSGLRLSEAASLQVDDIVPMGKGYTLEVPPLSFSTPPVARAAAPETPSSPILCGMSRPCIASPRLAASR